MRGCGGFDSPEKYALNCAMPELVKSSVGSPAGMSDAAGIRM